MTEAQRFHIGEILTVATGKFVCPTGLAGIRRLIEHVTGEKHMGHQLGRAASEILNHLREQLPWIDDIVIPNIKGETQGLAWLATVAAVYGEYHEVEPLPFGAYVGRHPAGELPKGASMLKVSLWDAAMMGPRPTAAR